MSRNPSVESLEARRVDLQKQLKEVDAAIKAARERETAKKQKALVDALAARGLLDKNLDEILAALDAAKPSAKPAHTPESAGV